MSWILVPLQYLFLIWRAKRYMALAERHGAGPKHARYIKKAVDATVDCEAMQIRFPAVTHWIDLRRTEEAFRFQMKK